MSPYITPKITVTPLPPSPGSKASFGAVIHGADLNNLDEDNFQAIREAIYKNKVVILKNQQNLLPAKQFEFVERIDPDAEARHGFKAKDDLGDIGDTSGVLADKPKFTVPGTKGGVILLGSGYQGEDHYGLKDVTLTPWSQVDYHRKPLTDEELESGHTRFALWHFDGLIHGSHPSRVTAFRPIRIPKGPEVTVHWDDGSDYTMKTAPGLTAFMSGSQIYSLLTDEEKKIADNSFWEPAPHPFIWTGTRKVRANGMGMEPGGEVLPVSDLPTWKQEYLYKYPLVVVNPVTGEKDFHILPDAVWKLYLKDSPDGDEKIIDDHEEVQVWLNNILDRILKPEYILFPPYEEGDLVMWNNWGVLHSAVEYPNSYGVRTVHQCHIASSTPPPGVVSA